MSGLDSARIPQVRYSSKSDIVCAMLRQLIISGEIASDAALRQRDLAARFGVSQTPVREALRRLESEGLVVTDPHRGATVARSRNGIVHDNSLIRAALEPLGAQLAASAITAEQLAHLHDLHEQMKANLDDHELYGALNREFHFAIYEAAASPILLSMMRLLWQAMPEGPKVKRRHEESAAEHALLLEALERGDGARAAELTRIHIIGSEHLPEEFPTPD